MADPASVDKKRAGLSSLTLPSVASVLPPRLDENGQIALSPERSAVAKVRGLDREAYRKTLAADAEARAAAARPRPMPRRTEAETL